jgi:hypothetical protein
MFQLGKEVIGTLYETKILANVLFGLVGGRGLFRSIDCVSLRYDWVASDISHWLL